MSTSAHHPAAGRRRPTPWDGLVALIILAAAALLLVGIRPATSPFLTATVTVNNVIVAVYDLNSLQAPVSLPIQNCPYPLTVEAERTRIRIAWSDCPGGDCVRTGWADRTGVQIVCLPNKLIISLSGGTDAPTPSIDGVTH